MKAIATAITVAMLLVSAGAHAADVVSNHVDWVVLKLEDLETDSHYYIAHSNDAVIKRGRPPYNDGPYNLQFECYQNSIYLSVFSADGVNLRYGEKYGKVKYDSEPPQKIRMEESDSSSHYINIRFTDTELRSMLKGNRKRLWMPYYGGDIVVDFSLIGMTAAAKEVARLNGCRSGILNYALKTPKDQWSVAKCQLQVALYRAEEHRTLATAELRLPEIKRKCAWLGDELWVGGRWSVAKCQLQVALYHSEARRNSATAGGRLIAIQKGCAWRDELWDDSGRLVEWTITPGGNSAAVRNGVSDRM